MLIGFGGLLLNHHWGFAEFWENRVETKYEKTIQISGEREPYVLLKEILNKLNMDGTIIDPGFSNDSLLFSFIVAKPGTRYDIQTNLNDGTVNITETKYNIWGTIRALHTLRNPTLKEQGERYQTAIATVWNLSIDILSVGLIIICLGGWYFWLRMSKKRFYLGLFAVTGGLILCIYFLLL